ncbi:Soluble lytic murein transglycosylase precursor [Serratia fonticola]|uniref:Soluble lytic murein transglycosylase n=1 Tax=Serratia fonticola TaxID=47917 RepID=A0A4U9UFH0_SERFO|nr:Soluble lytic murein transglycosylase precursor [Serratia fonticola]
MLAFSPQEPKPVAARCNFYYAKWATGDQQAAWAGADDIWMSGKTLPGSCDKLFSVWQAAGKQTPLNTLARMKLALKEGNSGLVNYLYRQLPSDYQTMGMRWYGCKTIPPRWKPSPVASARQILPVRLPPSYSPVLLVRT